MIDACKQFSNLTIWQVEYLSVNHSPLILKAKNRTLDLTGRVAVVGIMNLTPDSYVDGGKWKTIDEAVEGARAMIEAGADILDIGGESSGPGAGDISAEEESARILPAIGAIRKQFPDIWISVDTYKADVARKALSAGADMINDILAGRGDSNMFSVIANAGCAYVMMYSKDATARTTKEDTRYDNVIDTITTFLTQRMQAAMAAGIRTEQIIVDPGLGWFIGADPAYSFQILRELRTFTRLAPVFVSPSRKSFLAGPKKLPANERLPATLEATLTAVQNGARFIRTHDVGETKAVVDAAVSLSSL